MAGSQGDVLTTFKFLSGYFCGDGKKFETADGQSVMVYDVPSQIFCFGKADIPIYGEFQDLSLLKKIVKDNYGDFLPNDRIDSNILNEFRKFFFSHPDFIKKYDKLVGGKENYILGFNTFIKKIVELKIYDDEDLGNLKDYRYYFFDKGKVVTNDYGDGLKSDLYSFFEMDRYDNIDKKYVEEVLDYVSEAIRNEDIPDPRKFKNLNDWDRIPDEIIVMFEKLNLMNYSNDEELKSIIYEKLDILMLRKGLGFDPKGRQRYFLIYQSRENHIANSRRSGKTYLLMYLALRQAFLPGQMVLYILPVKENYSEQPFFYAKQFITNIEKDGLKLKGFRFSEKDFKISNSVLKSKIIFLSAKGGTKGGRSFSSNLVIMDEAGFIEDNNNYNVSYASTTDTNGCIIASSTINIDVPINRFFYLKISLDGADDSKCFSVDLWNNPFIPDKEKKRLETKYRYKDPLVWNCEYMAIFNTQTNGFQIDKFFQVDFDYQVLKIKDININIVRDFGEYKQFLLIQDPAKTLDKCGLALLGVRYDGTVKLICSCYIKIRDYILQTDFFIELYNYLKKKTKKPVDIVVDLGKGGSVLRDYYKGKGINAYGVLSTGGEKERNDSYRLMNVPRSKMERLLYTTVANQTVTGYSWNEEIRNEFETYDLARDRKLPGRKEDKHHNDVLSCLMMGMWVLYERRIVSFLDGKVRDEDRVKKVMSAFGDPQFPIIKQQKLGGAGGGSGGRFLY